MYWSGDDYDQIEMLAIDIYLDYDIHSFPVSATEICKKLGITLLPYSKYDDEDAAILLLKSKDACFFPATTNYGNLIVYNDSIKSKGRQRFSIFHDLKHYVNNDIEERDYDEDMANHFSRYFMCPTPYLIAKKITQCDLIASTFLVSPDTASNITTSLDNRLKRYGEKIFDYEKPLLKHLLGEDYDGGDEI